MPAAPLPCKAFLCAHWTPYSMANQCPSSFTSSQKALFSAWTSLRPGHRHLLQPSSVMTFCSLIHVYLPESADEARWWGQCPHTPVCKTIAPHQRNSLGAHTVWLHQLACVPLSPCSHHHPGAVQCAGGGPTHAITYPLHRVILVSHVHHLLPQTHCLSRHCQICHSLAQAPNPLAVYLFDPSSFSQSIILKRPSLLSNQA